MKKYLLILTVIAALVFPARALAQCRACEDGSIPSSAAVCQDCHVSDNPLVGPTGLITQATKLVAMATGAAAVIAMIVGGIKYTVSGGDAQAVQSAKNTIIYAAIGVVIAASAQGIAIFVLEKI